MLLPAAPRPAQAAGPGAGGFGGFGAGQNRFADAVAIATIDLDGLTPEQRAALAAPQVASSNVVGGRGGGGGRGGAVGAPVDSVALLKAQINALNPQATLRITRDAAAKLFTRRSIDGLSAGNTGATVSASLDFIETPSDYARNVVAIIPGSDPVLKHEYVAIGAHNDHVGLLSARLWTRIS